MITVAAIILAAAIPLEPCCGVVGVNTQTGIALAQNKANRTTFLFTAQDKNRVRSLRPGTAVSFSRRTGLSVAGYSAGAFRLIRSRTPGGSRPVQIEIDCGKFPEFCRGYKPGQKTIDWVGGTTAQDVIDYCNDAENMDQCVGGPD